MGCGGLADRIGARLGQAEMAHFAFFNEARHRTDRFFDRYIGVDPMLVVEIDCIDPEPFQRTFTGPADIFRRAVDAAKAVLVKGKAEFGRNHEAVAFAGNGPAQKLFIAVRAVNFSGIEKGDAQFNRAIDRGDGFRFVGHAIHALADTGHRHATQPKG